MPLIGIVHEKYGVKEFEPFFKGDIFLDRQRRFYGPTERWMGLVFLMRLGVLQNSRRAKNAGFEGNLKGEGRLLGGVFVLGKNEEGILLEHREGEFGDHVNLTNIENVIDNIKM